MKMNLIWKKADLWLSGEPGDGWAGRGERDELQRSKRELLEVMNILFILIVVMSPWAYTYT